MVLKNKNFKLNKQTKNRKCEKIETQLNYNVLIKLIKRKYF